MVTTHDTDRPNIHSSVRSGQRLSFTRNYDIRLVRQPRPKAANELMQDQEVRSHESNKGSSSSRKEAKDVDATLRNGNG
jgi:hypothetical protein